MAHRVNATLDDAVWQALSQVPKEERSKIINHAVIHWFQIRKRENAAQKMDLLRTRLPKVTTEDIVAWVRADRDRSQ